MTLLGFSFEESWKKIRREFDALTIVQTVIGYSSLIVFLVLPLFSMFTQAFMYQSSLSLHWIWSILTSTDFFSIASTGGRMWDVRRGLLILWGTDHGIFLNSLMVAFYVTLICVVVGVALAMVMGRYDFPGKKVFQVVLLVPLLATPFVNAYVIGKLFNPRNGLINWIFFDVLHLRPVRDNGCPGSCLLPHRLHEHCRQPQQP